MTQCSLSLACPRLLHSVMHITQYSHLCVVTSHAQGGWLWETNYDRVMLPDFQEQIIKKFQLLPWCFGIPTLRTLSHCKKSCYPEATMLETRWGCHRKKPWDYIKEKDSTSLSCPRFQTLRGPGTDTSTMRTETCCLTMPCLNFWPSQSKQKFKPLHLG